MTVSDESSSDRVAGRLPIERSALFAVPMPRNVRPGASALRVAIELAVTGAMRVRGLVTQVPELDRAGVAGGQRQVLVGVAEQQRALTHPEVAGADVLGLLDQADRVDLRGRADAEIHGCSLAAGSRGTGIVLGATLVPTDMLAF